jgi:hypothetical protein
MVRLYSNSHKWALTARDKAGTAAGTGSFSMTAGAGEVEGEWLFRADVVSIK